MYLDAGTGSSDTATLAFAFTDQTGGNPNSLNTRFWDIKVTQIPCNAAYRAPEGCLEYHTGKEGRFTSFNYQGEQSTKRMHLASQNQRICIRQEEGMPLDIQLCILLLIKRSLKTVICTKQTVGLRFYPKIFCCICIGFDLHYRLLLCCVQRVCWGN